MPRQASPMVGNGPPSLAPKLLKGDRMMPATAFCRHCFSNQPTREVKDGRQRTFHCVTCGCPVEVKSLEGKADPLGPPRILCIDDDRLLLGLCRDALAAHGFQVLTAPDGPSGIAAAQKERPELILLDVMMPRMNGLEVCRRLRTDPQLQDTPIILLTAIEDPSLSSKGAQVGATLTLRKPFGPSDLVSTIQRLLPRRANPLWSVSHDTTPRHALHRA